MVSYWFLVKHMRNFIDDNIVWIFAYFELCSNAPNDWQLKTKVLTLFSRTYANNSTLYRCHLVIEWVYERVWLTCIRLHIFHKRKENWKVTKFFSSKCQFIYLLLFMETILFLRSSSFLCVKLPNFSFFLFREILDTFQQQMNSSKK